LKSAANRKIKINRKNLKTGTDKYESRSRLREKRGRSNGDPLSAEKGLKREEKALTTTQAQ